MLGERRQPEQLEFGVKKAEVERRVVDDDFRALYVVAQLLRDLGKTRLVAQELGRQAVHRQRALFRIAVRIEVAVKVVTGQHAVVQFDAADFDDAVARARVQAGGFSIEDNLTHKLSSKSGKGKMWRGKIATAPPF